MAQRLGHRRNGNQSARVGMQRRREQVFGWRNLDHLAEIEHHDAVGDVPQDREIMGLMGVDQRRIYLITSAVGGALAGLAACLLVLQYDVHPFIGLSFGPITFMICVLGGLGNMIGGFVAAFVFAQIISLGGMFSDLEWGYVLAFAFFIIMMFIRPAGLLARRS